jgi:RNA polymerase sigma-70 factor (ECF subfamily)
MEAASLTEPNWDHAATGVWEAGRRAWPALELALPDFLGFASRERPWPDLSDELGADLYLAACCAFDTPGALQAFRTRMFPVVAHEARPYDGSLPFAEEVYQRLSEVMFVGGPDGLPKIRQYGGEGPLTKYIATAARRVALRMATKSARFQGEEALVEHFSQIHSQETAILKLQHRDLFNRALAIGLRALSDRERLILRLNLNHRVSTTKLAAMYSVTQPTISRWIQRAARTIFKTVKELVCDELEIDTRELQSLLFLVRSQIEISISQGDSTTTVPR